MKSIYTYYKERLIEISGKNRSLYTRKSSKKYSYDLGKTLDGDYEAIGQFLDFLWREKTYSFTVIGKSARERLYKTLGVERKMEKSYEALENLEGKEKSAESLRVERRRRDETKRALSSQVTVLKNLKRDIEEFAKETGRYELYIGYPFVQGAIGKDVLIKAPLLLFPVTIEMPDEQTVEIELKRDEPVQLNKVFIVAYAQHHRLNLEDMDMEFKGKIASQFKSIQDVVNYLRKFGFHIGYTARKGIFDFEKSKEPQVNDPLEVKQYCLLGRFPLANSIYNDYTLLERRRLTNEAIDELLYAKRPKKIKHPDERLFTVSSLDYAQQNAILNLNKNGNIVIYGPPGTGKSQTIVNTITDAIAKHKRVLVVSQKKAALDVVFNRLGVLNSKAMYILDPEKNKAVFYDRVRTTHAQVMETPVDTNLGQYEDIESKIAAETAELETISNVLFTPQPFGLSLQEMYANSYVLGKTSYDYTIYQNMLHSPQILALSYQDLHDNLRLIKEKNKAELYYKFLEAKKSNPFIDNLKPDIEFHTLTEATSKLGKLLSGRLAPFDMTKYPNSRQLIAYYLDKKLDIDKLQPLVKFVARDANRNTYNTLKTSYVLFPIYPFAKIAMNKKEKETEQNFIDTITAIDEYVEDFAFLRDVLTDTGYAMMVDNVLNGNMLYLKLLLNALNEYVESRDVNAMLTQLNSIERTILNFAYKNTTTKAHYMETLERLLPIRIYYEVTLLEDKYKSELSLIIDYENAKNRIISLKNELNSVSKAYCDEQFRQEYIEKFNRDPDNKNYLYQMSKQQNQWPIRKFMEMYGEYLFTLFPCWLLSPEGACTILPLVRNLFDIVLFDEASQVFIENTLPVIYRGKNIVVAGDSKQLRPTATFMKRYLGNDDVDELDLNTQAALEVESLLDLAMTRYKSAHLTYHYRSKNEELINFSNNAFYEGRLEISPNTTHNLGKKPITRIKVDGRWIDRKNIAEAKAVAELVKKLFNTRKNNESIGIITFNAEQESAIEDAIDEECNRNPKFRDQFLKEQNRKENGEDISIFVKNLENVQGDERDIIIFSIGYAQNEYGKVVAHFGPLSTEGGENRLNVAITRAKEKIFVVTSIEPEELNVEGTKNAGPKLFKQYLRYVRAVSNGNKTEAKIVLENVLTIPETPKPALVLNDLENKIKAELEKLGLKVETNLGNADYKISLAVYDKTLDRYLVGVECDYTAYCSSDSLLERDVYRPTFLHARGWDIIRVWSRDWWLHKQKVINLIVKTAEKNRQKFIEENNQEPTPKKPRNRTITIKPKAQTGSIKRVKTAITTTTKSKVAEPKLTKSTTKQNNKI